MTIKTMAGGARIRRRLLPVLLIPVLAFIIASSAVFAYSHGGPEGGAHRLLIDLALRRFIRDNADDSTFSRCDFLPDARKYGLDPAAPDGLFLLRGPAVVETGWFHYHEEEKEGGFSWWLREGGFAADAPEIRMGSRHFYDPVGANGPACLTDWVGRLFSPRMDAVAWALEASPHSWRRGRESLRQALACPDAAERRRLFADAWRCLGEAMHILSDLTVPAHTRNDAHASLDKDPYEYHIGATWISRFAADPASDWRLPPGLAETLAACRAPDQVFRAVAAYTNAHFFSGDTIAGLDPAGGKSLRNRNGERPYPLPRLADCRYDPATGAYTMSDFQGELLVAKRAKNGRPVLTKACAQSQAQRLIPVAVAANARLLELCLPRLQVVPDGHDEDGITLKGRLVALVPQADGGLEPFAAVVAPPEALLAVGIGEARRTFLCPAKALDLEGGFAVELPAEARGFSGTETAVVFDLGGIAAGSDLPPCPLFSRRLDPRNHRLTSLSSQLQ